MLPELFDPGLNYVDSRYVDWPCHRNTLEIGLRRARVQVGLLQIVIASFRNSQLEKGAQALEL